MSGFHIRSNEIVHRPHDDPTETTHAVEVLFIPCPTSNVRVNVALLDDYFLNLLRINGMRIIQNLHAVETCHPRPSLTGVGATVYAGLWMGSLNFLFEYIRRAEAEWNHRLYDKVGTPSISVSASIAIWEREMASLIGTDSAPPPKWWGDANTHASNRRVLYAANPDYYRVVFDRLRIPLPHKTTALI